MQENTMQNYIKSVLENMPTDWLNLTTHRLDIYNESLAKTQFLEKFETLFNNNNSDLATLKELPTAYDYIRLGHPLSCVLEWAIAKNLKLQFENVISFDSKIIPVLAILRTNLLKNRNTQIIYKNELPTCFHTEIVKNIYGYQFELKKVESLDEISEFDGSTIFISEHGDVSSFDLKSTIDFYINLNSELGSVLLINGEENKNYVSEIQHVRRRETIAMTPINCLIALNSIVKNTAFQKQKF